MIQSCKNETKWKKNSTSTSVQKLHLKTNDLETVRSSINININDIPNVSILRSVKSEGIVDGPGGWFSSLLRILKYFHHSTMSKHRRDFFSCECVDNVIFGIEIDETIANEIGIMRTARALGMFSSIAKDAAINMAKCR